MRERATGDFLANLGEGDTRYRQICNGSLLYESINQSISHSAETKRVHCELSVGRGCILSASLLFSQ